MMFIPPPKSFLKLNFEGASEGNLGPSGYEGILWDSLGYPVDHFASSCGTTTNNSSNTTTLVKVLQIDRRIVLPKIKLIGHLVLVINAAQRILNGIFAFKVLKSWYLEM